MIRRNLSERAREGVHERLHGLFEVILGVCHQCIEKLAQPALSYQFDSSAVHPS